MPRISCKICRRAGERLCGRAKCASVRKPYPPGARGARRRRAPTEYGRQLREKQKMKVLYGLGERQFRRYVREAMNQERNATTALLWQLELRLDSVVLKLGLAPALAAARHLTSHGHFLVNARRVSVPSYALRPNDTIQVRKASLTKAPFQGLGERLKKYAPPPWLTLDRETLSGTVVRQPTREDVDTPPANIQTILEYYSR